MKELELEWGMKPIWRAGPLHSWAIHERFPMARSITDTQSMPSTHQNTTIKSIHVGKGRVGTQLDRAFLTHTGSAEGEMRTSSQLPVDPRSWCFLFGP